eukprot:s191_g23.t1
MDRRTEVHVVSRVSRVGCRIGLNVWPVSAADTIAVIDLQLIEHGVVGASLRPRKWWKEPTGAAERLLPEGVEGLPQKLPLISQQRFWHPKTDLQRGLKRAWRARLSATADLPWTREGWSSW